MQLIQGAKALNTAVVAVIRSTTAAQDRIHLVACSTLAHAKEHGDLTLFARLVYGLPKGVRVTALKDWAHNFAPVLFMDKEMKCKLDKGEDAKPWDLDGAAELPFYQYKKEPAVKPLTLDAICEYLANKAKAKEGDDEQARKVKAEIAKIATFARAIANPVVTPTEFGGRPELAQAA